MKLNDKQMQRVVDWMYEKIPGGWKCTLCGETKGWKIDPTVYRHKEYDWETLPDGAEKKIKVIIISCSNCGHQVSMDPVTIGAKK